MKFLLTALNAKYIHSNLAVYNLQSYVNEHREHVEIAEYTINNYEDYILTEIYKRKPDVIGFSCYIWNIQMIKDIIRDLKKIMPHVPVWLGGPEVSYDMISCLEENPGVKGIMYGEGEEVFKNVLETYLDKEKELSNVSGIAYRNENEKIILNEKEIQLDMNDIPFCYEHIEDFHNKIIYYETSRGCPFSCSYCLSSIDRSVRFRDLEKVRKELKFFIDNKVKQVKFVDRTFNCNREHTAEIWKFLIEEDKGITNFHFEISADIINEEELNLMKKMRPGLIQLEIGVQSTNERTVKEIDRTMNIEKLEKIVKKIKEGKNIHQHLDLIAGLPYEDFDTFSKSFNQVYGLKPEQLQLGFLKVLKGSKMHRMAKEYEILYREKPTYEVLSTKWLSFDDMLEIKKVENMVEIYYNSGQFITTMKILESYYESAFHMYLELGNYYEKNEQDGISHSRMKRYELLLAFIKEEVLINSVKESSLFEESLLKDWYLRENAKSRPYWGSDLNEYKKEIQEFYQNEDQKREYLKNVQYEELTSKQLARQTHMEIFEWDFENKKRTEPYYCLFSYADKDNLNNIAKVFYIERKEMED